MAKGGRRAKDGRRANSEVERLTLAVVAARIRRCEIPWPLLETFLDGFYAADPETRVALMAERPQAEDTYFDAYLAALAEFLARLCGLPVPFWVAERSRFLDHWWCPGTWDRPRSVAILESPLPFRRRGICIDVNHHPSASRKASTCAERYERQDRSARG